MTGSVTFSVSVGGDGSTVTDDSNASTGLGNGGHRTRFVPCLTQTVAVAANTVAQATAAAASAAAAATSATTGAAASTGTSVTSLAVGTGTKTLTTQASKAWVPGMVLKYFNDSTHYMIGTCTAYNSTTGSLTISVATGGNTGTGTLASWTISVSPLPVIDNVISFAKMAQLG